MLSGVGSGRGVPFLADWALGERRQLFQRGPRARKLFWHILGSLNASSRRKNAIDFLSNVMRTIGIFVWRRRREKMWVTKVGIRAWEKVGELGSTLLFSKNRPGALGFRGSSLATDLNYKSLTSAIKTSLHVGCHWNMKAQSVVSLQRVVATRFHP